MANMNPAIWIHLIAALSATVLTLIQLVRPKGTPAHRRLGRFWVGAMLLTATSSFEIRELGGFFGFSWIHGLSVYTLVGIATALIHVRQGRLRQHQLNMRYLSLGLFIAGCFAVLPGRRLGDFLWNWVAAIPQ